MLRINLLPPYIYEGAKRRNVTVLWVIILAAVIGGVVYAKMTIDKETEKWKADEAAITARAQEADNMAAEATTINSQSQGIRDKANFVRNAQTHTRETYQAVLNNIKDWTWHRVLYDGVQPESQTVTLPAYAPTLLDVGRYMMYMERNPKITRVDVQMSSIPGFGTPPPQGSQPTGVRPLTGGGHNFTAVLSLVQPIPDPPAYGGGGGGSGGGGGGGGFPTPGGGISSGMGGGGGMGSGGAGGSGGGGPMGSGGRPGM